MLCGSWQAGQVRSRAGAASVVSVVPSPQSISCLKNEGLAQLGDAIIAKITGGDAAQRDWSVAINARHEAALQAALRFADAAREAFTSGLSPEFVAEELRASLSAVGDILGRVDHEEVLGKIFSTFCIGK